MTKVVYLFLKHLQLSPTPTQTSQLNPTKTHSSQINHEGPLNPGRSWLLAPPGPLLGSLDAPRGSFWELFEFLMKALKGNLENLDF